MKNTDFAYCAGVIDSDGTIYVDRFKDKRKKHDCFVYVLRVKVGQSDKQSIEWLSDVFGGKYRLYKYIREGAYNKRGLYYWAINNQKAAKLLEGCLPYLKIKKSQAKLAIEFAKLLSQSRQGVKVTEEQLRKREECAIEMRLLNQRKVA